MFLVVLTINTESINALISAQRYVTYAENLNTRTIPDFRQNLEKNDSAIIPNFIM